MHVKLDTGMGRLGTKDVELAGSLLGPRVAGVMTHFATADEPGDDLFPEQLERFTEFVEVARREAPEAVVHAANSAATFRDPAAHFDMVRCGVAIYGLDPSQGDPRERGLEPALTLESWVAALRRFEPGDGAGYGRRWRAAEPTWVATIPIGYGDGWRRGLSNDCDVLIRGRRYPLVGTVSMDNVTVDVGPDPAVAIGDPVVLIGEQGEERILAEEVAGRLDTINYEVTCGLSPRVRRLHVSVTDPLHRDARQRARLGRGRDGARRAARPHRDRRGRGGGRRPGAGRPRARPHFARAGVPAVRALRRLARA